MCIRDSVGLLALAVGCGGGGGGDGGGGNNPPPDAFTIEEDMNGTVYTYQVGSTAFGCTYEPTSDLALCIISASGVIPFAFFGPVESDHHTIEVRLSAADSDTDGDFFEEISLPVVAGSFVTFSEDGESVTIHVTLAIDPLHPQTLAGTGSLVSTNDIGSAMASAMRLVQRDGTK